MNSFRQKLYIKISIKFFFRKLTYDLAVYSGNIFTRKPFFVCFTSRPPSLLTPLKSFQSLSSLNKCRLLCIRSWPERDRFFIGHIPASAALNTSILNTMLLKIHQRDCTQRKGFMAIFRNENQLKRTNNKISTTPTSLESTFLF